MTNPPDAPLATKDTNNVIIVYALFGLGYFTVITTLVGVVLAYVWRGKDGLADSHYTFLIRTFWISLLLGIVGLILSIVGIGLLILLFLAVWGLARVITGFLLLNDGKPITGTKFLGIVAE